MVSSSYFVMYGDSFVQGYSKTAKSMRAVGHGVADVFTLGLWEIAGTPIEGAANGKKCK